MNHLISFWFTLTWLFLDYVAISARTVATFKKVTFLVIKFLKKKKKKTHKLNHVHDCVFWWLLFFSVESLFHCEKRG
jgi:hypothetical protein